MFFASVSIVYIYKKGIPTRTDVCKILDDPVYLKAMNNYDVFENVSNNGYKVKMVNILLTSVKSVYINSHRSLLFPKNDIFYVRFVFNFQSIYRRFIRPFELFFLHRQIH